MGAAVGKLSGDGSLAVRRPVVGSIGEAHDLGAVVGDQVAHLVQLEVASPGIGGRSVGLLQLEEAAAVDGTSSVLPVMVMLPWPNCCATAETSTPMPALLPPAAPMAEATISANSAREALNPVVLVLAMLWPITSRFLLAAFRPETLLKPMVCS